ncbi:hypothetical protein HanPI659440_Chr11g0419251 [Helianthus annuus]|nr:hypothetical protein HanPI659440_Chr11g0419251 [Helianthus annuus]
MSLHHGRIFLNGWLLIAPLQISKLRQVANHTLRGGGSLKSRLK